MEMGGLEGTLSPSAGIVAGGQCLGYMLTLEVGKCAPMQVIKQPVHVRTSATDEQK